ncbi:metal binding domain of Ada domain-containing protein [Trichoderma austrokoningii]
MDYDYCALPPPSFLPFFENDDSRWKAVKDRDINSDGLFVYAVRSTKIFCRPVCKSRHPRRCNVSFYATGKQAQLSGYRACKRCRPELEGLMPEETAVQKIREFLQELERTGINDEGSYQLTLSQMARQAKVSKWYFHRVFKKSMGVTPVQYLKIWRDTIHSQTQLDNNGLHWLDQPTPGLIDWPQLLETFPNSEDFPADNVSNVTSETDEMMAADFAFPNWFT